MLFRSVLGCTAAALVTTMRAFAAVATGTAATVMVAMVAPAGGMGSGCAAAVATGTAATATGMDGVIVITPGTMGCAAAGVLLGCTAAVGTVGGANRERDTPSPSNSPALGAGEAWGLHNGLPISEKAL